MGGSYADAIVVVFICVDDKEDKLIYLALGQIVGLFG